MTGVTISQLESAHRDWARRLLMEHWGATVVVTRGVIHEATQLPAFVALDDDEPVGLVTYHRDGSACEVVTLDATMPGQGIGRRLLDAVRDRAIAEHCRRLWLITTNDNTRALRFYQQYGFAIDAIHCDAIALSRRLKPEIPLIGHDNIPIRDEIELSITP